MYCIKNVLTGTFLCDSNFMVLYFKTKDDAKNYMKCRDLNKEIYKIGILNHINGLFREV